MYNTSIHKLFLFFFMNFILFNITGCATHSVWEKRAYNEKTVIDETKKQNIGQVLSMVKKIGADLLENMQQKALIQDSFTPMI